MELSITRILLAVAVMALVTYIPRMLPLTVFQKKIKNVFIKSFLAYVPYAVLAAMTIPDILFSTSSLISAIAGLLIALTLSYIGKGLLTVALGSTGAVLVTELLLKLF